MLNRFLLVLACVFMLVPSASAQSINVQKLGKADPGYTMDLTATYPAGVYYIGDALLSAHIKFDKASAFVGKLFGCAVKNADADRDGTVDTTANCVELADLASTGTFSHTSAHNYYMLDVNTAETGTNVSRLTIRGGNTAGGGGGVIGSGTLAAMNAYPDPKAGDLWQQTDDNGTADCASTGGSDTALLCQWNDATTAWVPAGLAGATDNLGNHTATTDLDLAGNPIGAIGGYAQSGGDFDYDPEALTGALATSTDIGRMHEEIWLAGNGTKDNGQPKTTIAGRLNRVYALTEAENYGVLSRLYCSGDSDCIGQFMMNWATGGAQTAGDEGIQSIRASAYDSWGAVRGTLTDPISSGAATTAVAVDPATVGSGESKMAGENKLIVFNADAAARDVDIVSAPSGTYDENGAIRGNSSLWGTGPNQFVLGAGEGSAAGLGVGDCFKADLNDFVDWDGGTSSGWLYITAVSTDTITTEFIAQGTDYDVPWGYLAQVGTDTGRVAPCGKTGVPTLNSSKALTALSVTTGADFPGVADNSTFEIHPYPGTYAVYGISSRVGRNYGGFGSTSHAFIGLNSMDTLAGSKIGRYQLTSVLDVQYSGLLDELVDGNYHAFENGLRCGNGDCEFGINYIYKSDTGELGPSVLQQSFAQIDFSTEDWDDDIARPIIDIPRFSSGLPAWDLTLDKTDGWGQNGDAFVRAAATQTITGTKTYTGTNDFSTGRLRARDSADCSSNNLGGELCVEGPGSLFVEGVEVSGSGGSGDVTAVGNCTTGACFVSGGTGTALQSDTGFSIEIDADDTSTAGVAFQILNGTGGQLFAVAEGASVAGSLATLNTPVEMKSTLTIGDLAATRGGVAMLGGDEAGGLPIDTYRILAPLTGTVGVDVYLPNDLPDSGNECLQISSTGQLSATGGACGGASYFTDAGTAIVPVDGHDFIVGGDEDQTCETGEICLDEGTGIISAEGLVIRDQASGSNYREFDDNPTTVPSAPSGANVRLYTTDDGELYKKDANDGSGDGVRLLTAQDFRRYPFFYTDFLGPNNNAIASSNDPASGVWDTIAITSGAAGSVSYQAGTIHHPGWFNILSVLNDDNTGAAITSHATGLLPGGGEAFEVIFQIVPASGATLTGARVLFGFLDSATITAPNDGSYISFSGSLTPACVSLVGGAGATTTNFAAPVTAATWYRGVVSYNADATEVYCSLYADGSDTPIETVTINVEADIPNGAGQETGTGFLAYTVDNASASHTVARVDWMSLQFNRRLTR